MSTREVYLRLRILVFVALFGAMSLRAADPGDEILARYLARTSDQSTSLRDVSMEVDIEAELPMLKKEGTLRALRHISRVGDITYEVLSYIGDNMVKKDVIARYMAAEVRSTSGGDTGSMAINEENYKFKYRGAYDQDGWLLHLFELRPRHKKLGLFLGWLWIEDKSALPVRESGILVRNPSVFLKSVEFTRDYYVRDGVPVPYRIESTIRTRLVGRAELRIRFSDVEGTGSNTQLAAQNHTPGE
jgi:hypothetical protein